MFLQIFLISAKIVTILTFGQIWRMIVAKIVTILLLILVHDSCKDVVEKCFGKVCEEMMNRKGVEARMICQNHHSEHCRHDYIREIKSGRVARNIAVAYPSRARHHYYQQQIHQII